MSKPVSIKSAAGALAGQQTQDSKVSLLFKLIADTQKHLAQIKQAAGNKNLTVNDLAAVGEDILVEMGFAQLLSRDVASGTMLDICRSYNELLRGVKDAAQRQGSQTLIASLSKINEISNSEITQAVRDIMSTPEAYAAVKAAA